MYWTVHLEGGPRRVNHAAVGIKDLIYSFGGYCTDSSYQDWGPMDVHILNTNNYRWTLVPFEHTDTNIIPYQRFGHTAVAYGDKIYIWGGRNNSQACNILYCFDTITHKWSTPSVTGVIPGARDGHAACVIDHIMYVFGGFVEDMQMFCKQVYSLDLQSMKWDTFRTKGKPPSYRDFHTATPIDNRMYIFGGRGDRYSPYHSSTEVYCEKMIYLDIDTKQWHETPAIGKCPVGRRSHSAFVYNSLIYIFGGYNGLQDQHFNDMYCFCPKKNEWQVVNARGKLPCKRRRHACVMIGDKLFLFGGTSPYPPRYLPVRQFSENDGLQKLMDHGDMHVLDFAPTLQTLSIMVVIQNRLDQITLSPSTKWEIKAMTTQNNISRPINNTG